MALPGDDCAGVLSILYLYLSRAGLPYPSFRPSACHITLVFVWRTLHLLYSSTFTRISRTDNATICILYSKHTHPHPRFTSSLHPLLNHCYLSLFLHSSIPRLYLCRFLSLIDTIVTSTQHLALGLVTFYVRACTQPIISLHIIYTA